MDRRPPDAPWLHRLHAVLLAACLLAGLAVSLFAGPSARAQSALPVPALQPEAQAQAQPLAPMALQTLTRARVSHDGGASWLDIDLPDRWAQRGRQARVGAHYALRFELAAAPSGPLALSFARLALHRSVSVNGQLLLQRADGPGFRSRRATAPAFIDLPPSLLQAGSNLLLIEVQHAGAGLLSAPVLGPTDTLRRSHTMLELLNQDLPQALNLASLGLALFMLTVWLRRRSELALGCFGALSLVTALRNLGYFADLDLTPAGFADWFFYSTQVASAALLAAFAHAMVGSGWRWHRRLVWCLVLALPLLAAVLAWLDHANLSQRLDLHNTATRMGVLRRWSYPALFLVSLPSLALLWRLARHQRRRSVLLVAVGMAITLLGGVHDYLALQGRPLLTDVYLLPYLTPLMLGAMSALLVARLVAATGAAEALAVELDARVALRTRQLSDANLARARFLSSASHDLRQPVLTIGLLASLLPDAPPPSPGKPSLVARLQAAVASLESLLNGLLDLSRLDPLVVQARPQALALRPLFDSIGHDAQATATAKGLQLRLRPRGLAVHADPVLLEQVLRNLVGNALRHTPRGGVLLAARRLASGAVRLQVWDTGIGIAAADQARIFEEFVQLANPGRDRRLGLGLGLAIAQRSAAAMGTRVTLRSAPGRGACFSLVLPAAVAAAPVVAAADAAEAAGADQQPLQAYRLWVLDDDEALRDALVLRLQHWGAEVRALGTLAALQQALAEVVLQPAQQPHLLLTDQRMADGNASLAVDQARAALGASLACLLVTGDPEASASQALVQAGMPLLSKPFAMPDLLRALLAALPAAR